jgi:hypothetical protein
MNGTVNVASSAQVAQLGRMIGDLQQIAVNTNNQVEQVRREQLDVASNLKALQAEFIAFVAADRRAKNLQLAEIKVINVRQELEQKYGHYGEVRRSATGILQAFDTGLVTEGAVRSLTEELMISSPRYWLAPVLVAVAAWSRDNRSLAEKAMEEAFRRDPDKTTLFFTLMLRRYNRLAASTAWLEQYLSRQDPGQLRREFVVILEAVANGGFGEAAKATVAERTEEWLEKFLSDETMSLEQRKRWEVEYGLLTPSVNVDEFRSLAQATPEWPELAKNLARARSHEQVGNYFTKIFAGELSVPPSVQAQIDDLLTMLVSEFDKEELPLRKEEVRLQSIIEAQGDEARANINFANNESTMNEQINFAGLLTNAAMRPAEAGVSVGTQRLAVALSKPWVVGGYDAYTAKLRAGRPMSAQFAIEGWTQSVSPSSDPDQLAGSLGRHIDAQTQLELAKQKQTAAIIWGVIAGVSVLVGFSAPFFLVVGIALGAIAWFNWNKVTKKRAAISAAGEAQKRTSIEKLRNGHSDFVDYDIEWSEADRKAEPVREQLESIRPSEHRLTRGDQARGLLK